MILLIALALALVIGLATGGSLEQLSKLDLRYGILAIAAVLLQSLVMYVPWLLEPAQRTMAGGLMIASHVLLLVFVWLNKEIPGMILAGSGLALNLLVIVANGGFMPISAETLQRMGFAQAPILELGDRIAGSKDIVLAQETTKLWFLSDVLLTPRRLPWVFAFSVGDIVLSVGILRLVLSGMRKPSETMPTALSPP